MKNRSGGRSRLICGLRLYKPGLLRFRLRVDRKSTSARDIVWLSVEIQSIFRINVNLKKGPIRCRSFTVAVL
jgi:hypothetical protein